MGDDLITYSCFFIAKKKGETSMSEELPQLSLFPEL